MNDSEKIKKQIELDLKELDITTLKKKYLAQDGIITQLFKKFADIPVEQKKEYGEMVNELKTYLTEGIEQKQNDTKSAENTDRIDPTAPFDVNTPENKRPMTLRREGTRHPLMSEMENILGIFKNMGFDIVESRQLDDDYHMFESLNIPKGHPARDIWDTFWTDEGLIPPAHTSTMQNRVMKLYKNPPIRVVMPGRTHRNEATDASHEHTFYQIEGIYIDKNISMGDMLGTIKTYLEKFFQTDLEVKIQPAYFPFTEPDAEVMCSCPFCKKTGCSVCGYSGWMEIMGCGMVNPFVLREGGINPDEYTGFAWGFGLDRLVMIKNGIEDVRRFHSGDLNFLKQF